MLTPPSRSPRPQSWTFILCGTLLLPCLGPPALVAQSSQGTYVNQELRAVLEVNLFNELEFNTYPDQGVHANRYGFPSETALKCPMPDALIEEVGGRSIEELMKEREACLKLQLRLQCEGEGPKDPGSEFVKVGLECDDEGEPFHVWVRWVNSQWELKLEEAGEVYRFEQFSPFR